FATVEIHEKAPAPPYNRTAKVPRIIAPLVRRFDGRKGIAGVEYIIAEIEPEASMKSVRAGFKDDLDSGSAHFREFSRERVPVYIDPENCFFGGDLTAFPETVNINRRVIQPA